MKDFITKQPILNSIFLIFFIIFIVYGIVSIIKKRKFIKMGKNKELIDNLTDDAKLMGNLILLLLFFYILIFSIDSCSRTSTSTKVHTDDIEFNEWTGEPEYNKSFYDRFYGH